MTMRVVLTGAGSFIGSRTAEHLYRGGFDVTSTYRTPGPAIERLRHSVPHMALVQLDLADRAAYARLPQAVDAIVHVAGVSSAPGVTTEDLLACNVDGMRNVLAYAIRANASRCIFTSTLSVHGRIDESHVDENTPIREPDSYGASKYLAERLLAEYASRFSSVAIRLPGVVGPGAHRAWLPTMLERVKSGRAISIYHPDRPFNNVVHVDDLAEFIVRLLRERWNGFHAFPIGAGDALPVRRVIDMMMKEFGQVPCSTESPGGRPSFLVSSSYATRHFGYEAARTSDIVQRYLAVNDSSS